MTVDARVRGRVEHTIIPVLLRGRGNPTECPGTEVPERHRFMDIVRADGVGGPDITAHRIGVALYYEYEWDSSKTVK